jgi:hypothetical protein
MRRVSLAYHKQHMDNMGFFVAPLMLIDAALAAMPCLAEMELARETVPFLGEVQSLDRNHARIQFGLLVVIWLSTAVLSVPTHDALLALLQKMEGVPTHACVRDTQQKVKRDDLWRKLVGTNWVRTIGWTLRAVVALEVVVGAFRGAAERK